MQTDTRAGLREVYASGAIVEVPCMGQIKRRFEDIWRAEACPVASGTLHQIAQLYDVESRARGLPPTLRVELRQKQAAKVFDDLEVRLAMQLTRISGKTALAAAIRYGLARMELLRPYLNCGTLELENNAAERGRRAIDARGADKLFVGSEAGGKAAAIAYTLIETAKLNGVDPNLWLADIIAHMAGGKAIKVDDLLPWRWSR
jgi:transposase